MTYGGGGGGGGSIGHNGFGNTAGGPGGSGGGGAGGNWDNTSPAQAGAANTGGGGGGSAYAGSGTEQFNAASGGSGIVIVRYQGSQVAAGGTVTSGTGSASGYTLHTYTNTGTNSFDLSGVNMSTLLGATLTGTISGNGNMTYNGPGRLTLAGTNTYTGTTTVAGGTLVVNGATTNSAVTVQSGATLAGSGSVGATTLLSGATISPGNSPGTLTITGNEVWYGGANYNWEIYNAAGTEGTDWDLLNISGILDLSNLSSTNKFNINMWSLASLSPDTNGDAINFNNLQNYRWTIATAAGGITNFSTNYFNLFIAANNGTGGFGNDLGGGLFTLEQVGNDLDIVFTAPSTAVPEPGTWAAAALLAGGAAFMRWRKRAKVS